MVFKAEEKIILKAIMTRPEINDINAAYTPIRIDELQTGMDERLIDITLDNMAKKSLLFTAGEYVSLSDMGTNAYRLLNWIEKNENAK